MQTKACPASKGEYPTFWKLQGGALLATERQGYVHERQCHTIRCLRPSSRHTYLAFDNCQSRTAVDHESTRYHQQGVGGPAGIELSQENNTTESVRVGFNQVIMHASHNNTSLPRLLRLPISVGRVPRILVI